MPPRLSDWIMAGAMLATWGACVALSYVRG